MCVWVYKRVYVFMFERLLSYSNFSTFTWTHHIAALVSLLRCRRRRPLRNLLVRIRIICGLVIVVEHGNFRGRAVARSRGGSCASDGGSSPTRSLPTLFSRRTAPTRSFVIWLTCGCGFVIGRFLARLDLRVVCRRWSWLWNFVLPVDYFAHDASSFKIARPVELFEDGLQFALHDQICQLEVVFGARFHLTRRIASLLLQRLGPHRPDLLTLTTIAWLHLTVCECDTHSNVQSCRSLQTWLILVHFRVKQCQFE